MLICIFQPCFIQNNFFLLNYSSIMRIEHKICAAAIFQEKSIVSSFQQSPHPQLYFIIETKSSRSWPDRRHKRWFILQKLSFKWWERTQKGAKHVRKWLFSKQYNEVEDMCVLQSNELCLIGQINLVNLIKWTDWFSNK